MDFKHLIGKQVVWTGTIMDPTTEFNNTYILFSDKTGMCIPDVKSGAPSSTLANAEQTLSTIVAENFDMAISIVALAELLKHKMYTSWVNKLVAEKEDKEKIEKIQAQNLPAAQEFEAMVKGDVEDPGEQHEDLPPQLSKPDEAPAVPAPGSGLLISEQGQIDVVKS